MLRLIATLGQYDPYTRSVPIVASTPNDVNGQALTSWDLARFEKNPVILWAHDNTIIPLGLAKEVEFDPAVGLKMRVYFASEKANPFAEQVAQCCAETVVRAVSVGYDPPRPEPITLPDGHVLPARTTAELSEVSFVPVGMDEDAGTPALNPEAESEPSDEEMQKRASKAASDLARYRQRVLRKQRDISATGNATSEGPAVVLEKKKTPLVQPANLDAKDPFDLSNGDVLRLDRVKLDQSSIARTSIGGFRIPARIARTGVLVYRNPDGTTRRELRLEEEVFKADSLATLADVPVIDIKHHTRLHDPKSWKEVTLGHVSSVRRDGKFIASELVVQDQETLDGIDNGERTEISCGYRCHLDMTPGVYEGEQYDCVQRNIRYNHAALCPPNRGRAGPEVGLRLDDNSGPAWGVANLTEEGDTTMTIKIRLDGKEYEVGSQSHLDAIEHGHTANIAKLKSEADARLAQVKLDAKTEVDALKVKLDTLEGERDGLAAKIEKFNADAKASKEADDKKKKEDDEAFNFKKKARRKLERMALRFFADEDEDEDKLDAKLDSMSDRDLMLHCIGKSVKNFDAKSVEGKSDDYVAARFDSIVEKTDDEKSIGGVVRAAAKASARLDADDDSDAVTKARAKRDAQAAGLWKEPPPAAR